MTASNPRHESVSSHQNSVPWPALSILLPITLSLGVWALVVLAALYVL
jgi:hypothetical protein